MATPQSKRLTYGAASNYTEMRYPARLGPHSIVLNFRAYEATRAGVISAVGMPTSIALPIPSNLTDSFSLKVQQYDLGMRGDIARSTAAEAIKTGTGSFENIRDAASDSFGRIKNVGIGALLRAAMTSTGIGDDIVKGIQAGTGTIINPHAALTFDGVDLKNHKFEWNLVPESAEDSERINEIIKKIRYEILPEYAQQRTFLKYPSVVDIGFLGTEEGYLYNFKRCMVNNFFVNYAGAGVPAFVERGRPASIQLSLSLTEMEIWTKDDFGGGEAS